MEKTIRTNYFYGNEVSDYGKEHKRVDYGTLAKSFDAVLNNGIWSVGWNVGYWERVNGADNSEEIEELRERIEELEEEKDELEEGDLRLEEIENDIAELQEEIEELENYNEPEVFQWYIIDGNGADTLEYWTDEEVYYNEALDMYLWGVTHCGTAWSYVLTDIRIEDEEDEDEEEV